MMESHSRLVELKGTTNLRDLGGYRTRDGRQQVRWGKVFRSDSLQPVAMADLASVLRDKMHVTDVFDLRAAAEIESRPYTLPDGICYHPLPLTAGMDRLHEYEAQNITITADIIHEIASDNYLSRVDHHGPDFATFFRFLMAPPTPPAGGEAVVLFHCTAGKDRTGLLAALLLAALGVERSTIMEDFLLTNQCFRRPVGLNVSSKKLVAMDAAAADAIWAVRPLYLEKTFAHLDERYGGVDGYLARQLHLSAEDLSLLRGNLLV